MLLQLLYRAAEWHALSKLRMHTDSTLKLLNLVTREFGRLMRQFRDRTSDEFGTVELPRETGARKRGGRSSKKLNLNTYKFHALGDYVATIRLFGTTDSFSTQLGELAHRLLKRRYGLTNKKNAPGKISGRYRRADHFSASGLCDPSQEGVTGGHDDAGDTPSSIIRYLLPATSPSNLPLFRVLSRRIQRQRTLFISCALTSSVGFLARASTATTLVFSRTKKGTRFESSTTQYSQLSNYLSTTPHATSGAIAIISTLPLVPMSCSGPRRLAQYPPILVCAGTWYLLRDCLNNTSGCS